MPGIDRLAAAAPLAERAGASRSVPGFFVRWPFAARPVIFSNGVHRVDYQFEQSISSPPIDVPPDLDRLQLFFGETTVAAARVYARWPEAADRNDGLPGPLRLCGTVQGPFSELARTLRASYPLVDRGPGGVPLAEAAVTDPCFWTPGAPYFYRATVELRSGEEKLATTERLLGIRPLGVRGGSFQFADQTWIPRAVRRCIAPHEELHEWRERQAVMIVEGLDEPLLDEASRHGVPVFVSLKTAAGDEQQLLHDLRRLARWPAAAMAILAGPLADDKRWRTAAPNLLLAQWSLSSETTQPAGWADCVVLEAADVSQLPRQAGNCHLPMIVIRRAAEPLGLPAALAACDQLKLDLAGKLDAAGYAV